MSIRFVTAWSVVFLATLLILPSSASAQLAISGPTSVTVGQTAQYKAYSNGQLLTSGVWFYTYETTRATIDHATGILTGVTAGAATVRFDYVQGSVNTAATPYPISVVASAPPTLAGVSITGPTSVTVGQAAQYKAYSNGQLLTSGVWFYTYETTRATIDHATGILTGVTAGAATVRFDYVQGSVNTAATPYPISVVAGAATLTGVSISGPTSVTVGQTAQYTTRAAYSDGSSQSLTTGPMWSTSSSSLATIAQSGVLSALAAGTVNVKAAYGSLNAQLAVGLVASSVSGVTIYVSPSGSDSNAGTQSSPVRTIQRGVALGNQANVGNDVLISIAAGVYREAVTIAGLSTTKTLTLQGQGASTVLTGADDWSSGWTVQGDGSYVHSWPYKWGMKAIPNYWGDYWNWDGKGYLRDRLRRSEMVYVNGLPLKGVLTLAEAAAAGTFYVDETNAVLRMRPPPGVSVAGSLVEVGIRLTPLAINGRNNVTLRNLAVMRNRGAVQDAAFQTANLQNLTFDGLSVQWMAYTGVGSAYITGLHIRNSTFSDNGVMGIGGIGHNDVVFEDNEVSRNNWRGWPAEHKGFDSVTKWSESRDVVVRRSRFTDNWGHGLWFDGDNQRVLVENIFSGRNAARGLSVESNGGPLTIQDSKFCENGLAGITNARSNNVTLSYNQIFNNGYYQIVATGAPTPTTITDSRTGTPYVVSGANWTISNNIIKGQPLAGGDPPTNECYPGPCGWAFWASDDNIYSYIANTLTSDYNQWYHSSTTKSFRVPDAKGGAVDFTTFRTLMSTVKPNEAHSTWGPPNTTLSCTP